uniref:BEN domain-containing protein n=1 Tax=Amphimedon queenslandica TaxID=400682 RepID=A0A1X7TFP8_AMPQE
MPKVPEVKSMRSKYHLRKYGSSLYLFHWVFIRLLPSLNSRRLLPSLNSNHLLPSLNSSQLDPFTQEQSLAPITQEQSLGPITQELHVLTIPPSITPPPLPPSITSPPLSYSITHTPASTPPLSDGLLDPDEVIANYPKLRTISNIGRLAVRLASESYFGKDLLKRSTVYGLKGNASLPGNKVRALKKKLCNLYRQYVDTPAEFEPVWMKCVNAINHHASGLRKKDKDGVTLELN